MTRQTHAPVQVTSDLIEAIRTFPGERTVLHCGQTFQVSAFDFYAVCPRCGTRIKLRSFSAAHELEDVFDAVLEWLNQPANQQLAKRRQEALQAEGEE